MAESKCGRYSIRDRIYYSRLFIGSKNKLVQRTAIDQPHFNGNTKHSFRY